MKQCNWNDHVSNIFLSANRYIEIAKHIKFANYSKVRCDWKDRAKKILSNLPLPTTYTYFVEDPGKIHPRKEEFTI